MSLEKLGLLFLINYFNQLGEVKNHVLLALKEILLAVQSSVEIFNQSARQPLLGNKTEFLDPLFSQVNRVLNFTIEKVAPDGVSQMPSYFPEGMKLKEHIVSSIISAIDDEIENTREPVSEKSKLKVEALQTVRQVLINQKKKPVVPFSDHTKPANVA